VPPLTGCVRVCVLCVAILWLLHKAELRFYGELEEVAFSPGQLAAPLDPYDHPSWLSECRSIYLDMGSNRGVQVRKLFEGWKYEGAPLVKIMRERFGVEALAQPSSVSGICALGFEPNPNHHLRLSHLQDAYVSRGWNVHFYPFAAWSAEGTMNMLHRRQKSIYSLQKGGARLGTGDEKGTPTRTIDMAMFLGSLPPRSVRLWKLDVEGAEWEVLAHLVKHNLLCHNHVAEIMTELHCNQLYSNARESSWRHGCSIEGILGALALQRCSGNVTSIQDLDDEEFGNDVDDQFSGAAWFWRVMLLLVLNAALFKQPLWDRCRRQWQHTPGSLSKTPHEM